MKIHEFQGKELFRKAGVAVLDGHVAKSPEEAADAYKKLGGAIAVVKSQIHAGGRGKGTIKQVPTQRGVQLVRSAEEAATVATNLLGNTLVTIQTGPEGQTVRQVFVEAGCDIARELYLGIVLDRAASMPVLMVSSEGGVEIEKVAEETPELIFKEHFDPAIGLSSYQVRKLCWKLGIKGESIRSAEKFMKGVCKFYVDLDCSMAEINPLVITKSGQMLALDAKITFDDNAMFRHKDLAELRDLSEEEPAEVRAQNTGLSYVKLDGNIGCLVNGAGLAMSTMDIIQYHGGKPANFLDVGGGATADQVTEAFSIILSDPNVKGVLVNIFGGIAKCSTIATAIIEASKRVGFKVPLVVRLEGTEVEQGRKMLNESGIAVINATDLTDAAKKIVAAVVKA
jgi:succinyl-CoA synthetase beta subunit